MERLRHYSHGAMAMLLETDPNVVGWTTETDPITVSFGGHEEQFVAHFEATGRDGGKWAYRITRAKRPSVKADKFYKIVATAFEQQGVQFRLRLECDLLADPRLSAARTVLWHRPWRPSETMLSRVAAMADQPPATLGDLHEMLGGQEETWPYIISLIAWGSVDVGRAISIGPQTRVIGCRMERSL